MPKMPRRPAVPLDKIEIVPRAGAEAALDAIGGTSGTALLERARKVERAIYRISAALIPPNVKDIDREATAAYRPFDIIESFRIPYNQSDLLLRPACDFR